MSNTLQEIVVEIMELTSYNCEPPIDNSGKIMAAVAFFGLACVMDSDVRKEAEDFCMNNQEKE